MAHGDKSKSRVRISNNEFRKGWDHIFGQLEQDQSIKQKKKKKKK